LTVEGINKHVSWKNYSTVHDRRPGALDAKQIRLPDCLTKIIRVQFVESNFPAVVPTTIIYPVMIVGVAEDCQNELALRSGPDSGRKPSQPPTELGISPTPNPSSTYAVALGVSVRYGEELSKTHSSMPQHFDTLTHLGFRVRHRSKYWP